MGDCCFVIYPVPGGYAKKIETSSDSGCLVEVCPAGGRITSIAAVPSRAFGSICYSKFCH